MRITITNQVTQQQRQINIGNPFKRKGKRTPRHVEPLSHGIATPDLANQPFGIDTATHIIEASTADNKPTHTYAADATTFVVCRIEGTNLIEIGTYTSLEAARHSLPGYEFAFTPVVTVTDD